MLIKAAYSMHLLGWTQEEIGEVIGVTQPLVAGIIKNFNTKLFYSEYASGLTPEQIATNHNLTRALDTDKICNLLPSPGWLLFGFGNLYPEVGWITSIANDSNTCIFAFPQVNCLPSYSQDTGRLFLAHRRLVAMWLSQTAIAKELGVTQRTISNWLSANGCDDKEAIIANIPHLSNSCLSVRAEPRYLVVCESVEKFRPPDDNSLN